MDISKAKALTSPRMRKRRIGRGTGSRRGKTSGRGHNGAKSRSGWSSRGLTGGGVPLWRRLPKGGFSNAPFKTDYGIVNVAQLNGFPAGSVITPEELGRIGMLKQVPNGGLKVLGNGEIDRALTVRANAFSKSAVAKIEAAGGSIELIPGPKRPVRNKMGHKAAARLAAMDQSDAAVTGEAEEAAAPQEEAPQEEAPQEEAPQAEAPQEEAPQEEAPQEAEPQATDEQEA